MKLNDLKNQKAKILAAELTCSKRSYHDLSNCDETSNLNL